MLTVHERERALGGYLSRLACRLPTAYQRTGFSGGYSETRLDENVWTVNFNGNGFTSDERAADFALLRSAELALESGYRYFVVVDRSDHSSFGTYTTPTTTSTTARAHAIGNNAYGSSESATYGGETYVFRKPGKSNTIVGFKERPESVPGMTYDAMFVRGSIRAKYGMR